MKQKSGNVVNDRMPTAGIQEIREGKKTGV
jgi:hypothetical protein